MMVEVEFTRAMNMLLVPDETMWKNAPVPEGTPYGTRCVSLGCSSMIIHLEVHDEPLVSFAVSSRWVQDKSGVFGRRPNPPYQL